MQLYFEPARKNTHFTKHCINIFVSVNHIPYVYDIQTDVSILTQSANFIFQRFSVNQFINSSKFLSIEDSFSYHNGMAFSTADNDNDRYSKNCAQMYGGGWWYNSCHRSNLNGKYYQKQTPTALSISWLYWKDTSDWNSLKSSKMIIKSK